MPALSSSDVPGGQALQAGTRLEEFIIEQVLGSGGFGITYLARDKRLGRQVVIKENLPAQFCWRDTTSLTVQPRQSSGEDADNFQYSLESFEKEAATLASLDHPGIVKVLRSFEANGTAYFVMPFVEGATFDEVIKERHAQGDSFSEEELTGLLWRVLEALAYLHDRGIYHRDIKPGNLLITTQGDPVLIDFGAARQRLSERSLTVIESPGYTPFEQMQSRGKVGPWSDLYALGGTVYKAITGETPAKAADRILEDSVVPLAERTDLGSRYSQGLLQSIDRAMRPKLSGRLQSAEEWVGSLQSSQFPIHDSKSPDAESRFDREVHSATLVERAGAIREATQKSSHSRNLIGVVGLIICLVSVVIVGKKLRKGSSTPQWSVASESKTSPNVDIAARVMVTANREGAEVYRGGKSLGKTPLHVTLPFGSHVLEVLRSPWKMQQLVVQVGNDGSASPRRLEVAFPLGQLRVTSNQVDAAVWLSGRRFSLVPAALELEPGEHKIELRLHGWESKILTVLVDGEGKSSHAIWDPKFEYGALNIEGTPEGVEASIIYNGGLPSKWEILPITKSLPPGRVLVKFRKSGYDDFEVERLIEEAKQLVLKASLEPSHPLNHGRVGSAYTVELPGSGKMDFRYCPPGAFVMGTRVVGYGNWELPAKGIEDEKSVEVDISKGFWMGRTEVSQQQWLTLMASNPSEFNGKNSPVENVSFIEAQTFAEALNERVKLPAGWRFSLPTEAQWEYACRAGSTTAFSFGDSLTSDQANFNGSKIAFDKAGKYLAKPTSVGAYSPNDWGIFDMHGNVSEWCVDWYATQLSAGRDPVGPRLGTERVIRGGSWRVYNGACRSARRDQRSPNTKSFDIGLRVSIVR
jgi:formylglycine-generating enzyme required for sulfatase activity/serine/threonine protein kinase